MKEFRTLDKKTKKVNLWFHAGQQRAWDSLKRIVLMLCGAQGGKTVLGPHWLFREIRKCGPGDYLAGTSTFPLLEKKMLPEFRYVFEELYNLGTFNDTKKLFTFYDGKTRVIFFSGTNPEAIEAATARAAWVDEGGQEQFRRQTWEAIERRLAVYQGRTLFTTTPYSLGWLKVQLYDRWVDGDTDIDVIQFESIENPSFPKEEFERQKGLLPSWKFDLFYRGQFSRPAGLIYDSFSSTCIIPRFEIPPNWNCFVGHDFGLNNTAAVWYALEPTTGYLYVYREYHASGAADYHAAKFVNLSKEERIIRRVGGAHHEDGYRTAYTLAGWPILEPSEKRVEAQMDTVYALHKQNRIYVFNDLHQYLDEKHTYSWELDDNYQPIEKIANKESFHLMDAERYILNDFRPDVAERRQEVSKIPVKVY